MPPKTRKYDPSVPLLKWWAQSSDLFKAMVGLLSFAFCIGTVYATISYRVEANASDIAQLKKSVSEDHDTITRIDQNVQDMKVFWAVPSLQRVGRR